MLFICITRRSYQSLWTGAIRRLSLDSELFLDISGVNLNASRLSWFLDNPDHNWTPPPSLTQWMDQAREDGKAIVYIGFGSIIVPNSRSVTERIIKAVLKSMWFSSVRMQQYLHRCVVGDVRAIISKGWSSRMSKKNDSDIEFPPECYPLDKVPHEYVLMCLQLIQHHI